MMIVGLILLIIVCIPLVISGVAGVILGILFLYVIVTGRWPKHDRISGLAKVVCGIYRFPIGEELEKFKDNIWDRYTTTDENGVVYGQDKALSYLERIVDREINKARGVLPFNSIILVLTGGLVRNGIARLRSCHIVDWHSCHFVKEFLKIVWDITFIDLILSSLLLLELFTIVWGKVTVYEDWRDEICTTIVIIRNRGVLVNTAMYLSFFCLLSIMCIVFVVPLFYSN